MLRRLTSCSAACPSAEHPDFWLQVTAAAGDFLHQLGRHTYVTPTSYLELLGAFR